MRGRQSKYDTTPRKRNVWKKVSLACRRAQRPLGRADLLSSDSIQYSRCSYTCDSEHPKYSPFAKKANQWPRHCPYSRPGKAYCVRNEACHYLLRLQRHRGIHARYDTTTRYDTTSEARHSMGLFNVGTSVFDHEIQHQHTAWLVSNDAPWYFAVHDGYLGCYAAAPEHGYFAFAKFGRMSKIRLANVGNSELCGTLRMYIRSSLRSS